MFYLWCKLTLTLKVCWKCKATKGTNDVAWCYSNVDESAPWRSTMYTEPPWPAHITPSLAKTMGFCLTMIGIDLLHIWYLGVGRDLCASAIYLLARNRRYWQGSNVEKRLDFATQRLKWFASQNGLKLQINRLTKQNVNWKGKEYPELRVKGFDCSVILRWLNWEMRQQDLDNDLLSTVPYTQK